MKGTSCIRYGLFLNLLLVSVFSIKQIEAAERRVYSSSHRNNSWISGGRKAVNHSEKKDADEDDLRRFKEKIIFNLKAEEDVVGPGFDLLKNYIQSHPEGISNNLRDHISKENFEENSLERRINLQPECILSRTKDLSGSFFNRFVWGGAYVSPDIVSAFLLPLNTIIKDLQVIPGVESLVNFYRSYIEKLLACEPENRETFLKEKAFLIFEDNTFYRISQDLALKISSKNEYNYSQKSNKDGNHSVYNIDGVHYKLNGGLAPLTPSMESAVRLISRKMCPSFKIPPSLFFCVSNVNIYEVTSRDGDLNQRIRNWILEGKPLADYFNSYPADRAGIQAKKEVFFIQPSQTTGVVNFKEFLQENPYVDGKQFNPSSITHWLIFSLLTRPYDFKPDNLTVIKNEDGALELVGIDNDDTFSPLVCTENGKKIPGVRNILYCLSPLMSLPLCKNELEDFTVFFDVMVDFFKKRQRYRGFSKSLSGLSQEVRGELRQFELELKFLPETAESLLETWEKIKKGFESHMIITGYDLLRYVDPFTSAVYEGLHNKYKGHAFNMIDALYSLDTAEDLLGYQNTDISHFSEIIHRALSRDDRRDYRIYSLEDSFVKMLESPILSSASFNQIRQILQATKTIFNELSVEDGKAFCERIRLKWPVSWNKRDVLNQLIHSRDLDFHGASFFMKHLLSDQEKIEKDRQGKTILHVLIERFVEDNKILTLPLDSLQPVMNIMDNRGETPLDLLFKNFAAPSIIKYIIALGAYRFSFVEDARLYFYKMNVKSDPIFCHLLKTTPDLEWLVMMDDLFPTSNHEGGRIVQTAHFGQRAFPLESLLFKDGLFIKRNKDGQRESGYISWGGDEGVWIKLFPELPGREEAIRHLFLDHLVKGDFKYPLIPPSTLIRIPLEGPWTFFKKGKKSLPCVSALVSKSLGEKNLYKHLEDDPRVLEKLDHESLSWLLILSMIVNPEDGRADNYCLREHPENAGLFILSSIDNDHVFVPPVAKEMRFGRKSSTLQVKNFLYCLDQMKEPLSQKVVSAFKGRNTAFILQGWLDGLSAYSSTCFSIFSDADVSALQEMGSLIGCPFEKGEIQNIYRKMVRLQDALGMDPRVSALDLLITAEPLLGRRYANVLREPLTPSQRFLKVDGEFFSMAISKKSPINQGLKSNIRATQTLEHFMGDIVTRRDFATKMRQGACFPPFKAREELDLYLQEEAVLAKILTSGKSIPSEYLPLLLEGYIKTNPWDTIWADVQRKLVFYMSGKSFRELYLKNCRSMTKSLFKSLNVENLVYLDVSGCSGVSNKLMKNLSRDCAGLQHLDISRTPIRGIYEKGKLGVKPFQGPALKRLYAEGCSRLEFMDLDAPNLVFIHVPSLGFKNLSLEGMIQIDSLKKHNFLMQYLNKNITGLDYSSLLLEESMGLCTAHLLPIRQYLRHNEGAVMSLNLSNTDIDDAVIQMLTEYPTEKGGFLWLNLESATKVGDLSFKCLGQYLLFNKSLKTLNLRYTAIGFSESEVKWVHDNFKSNCFPIHRVNSFPFFDHLGANRTLTSLDLSGAGLDSSAIFVLANALKTNSTLEALYLDESNLGSSGIRTISEALSVNSTLKSLSIEGNEIRDGGLNSISELLSKNSTLQRLNLAGNDLGKIKYSEKDMLLHDYPPSSIVGVKKLLESLEINKTLTSLDLSNNPDLVEWIGDFVSFFHYNQTSITELILNGNQFTARNIQSFINLPSLVSLSFENNNINGSLSLLKESLWESTTLTHLNLSSNHLEDEDITSLSEVLKKNKTLKRIELRNVESLNGRMKNFSSLLDALDVNTTITEIDLRGNTIFPANRSAIEESPRFKEIFKLSKLF